MIYTILFLCALALIEYYILIKKTEKLYKMLNKKLKK